jgi:hypothetical protein
MVEQPLSRIHHESSDLLHRLCSHTLEILYVVVLNAIEMTSIVLQRVANPRHVVQEAVALHGVD